MRQRARADNFTVCYRKKTNGSQFFMRLSCYRQCYDEIHDQQQTHKNLTSIWKLDKIALLSQHSGQNGIIFLLYQGTMMISLSLACMYFHFSSMRISFITWKLQESTKLRQLRERHKLPFWFCFLNSIPGDRTEISHMDRPQNSCQLPSQPAYQDHMRRPSHCKWWLLVKIIVLLNNTRSTAHDCALCLWWWPEERRLRRQSVGRSRAVSGAWDGISFSRKGIHSSKNQNVLFLVNLARNSLVNY